MCTIQPLHSGFGYTATDEEPHSERRYRVSPIRSSGIKNETVTRAQSAKLTKKHQIATQDKRTAAIDDNCWEMYLQQEVQRFTTIEKTNSFGHQCTNHCKLPQQPSPSATPFLVGRQPAGTPYRVMGGGRCIPWSVICRKRAAGGPSFTSFESASHIF